MNQRYTNIIKHYKRYKLANPDTWIEYCSQQPTLDLAIEKAALCTNQNNKRHPHQYRLKRIDLSSFSGSLQENISDIASCTNFNDLINSVRSLKVAGIGELTVYDVAVRIGSFMNIWPEQIYLHAGAKVGAFALIGHLNGDIISKQLLPEEFQTPDLSCYELEDIMCIYKKIFLRNQ